MRRHFAGFVALGIACLVATLLAPVAAERGTAAVGAQVSINAEQEEIAAINAIYQDFLGRAATQEEVDRFLPRLGVGQSLTDVRARVVASRSFLLDVAGGNRDGFVRKAYEEVLGRAPTSGELVAGKRQLFRGSGPLVMRRLAFAERLFDRADYDPDELGVRELVVHTNAAGEVVRFAFELDEPFSRDAAVTATVSIRGNQLTGQTRVRAFENIVSFIPETPVERFGKIVGLVFLDDGDGVRIADISAPSRRLPPRTVDSPWPDRVFDDQRIVAYYGNHISPLLGVLGETGPEGAVARVKRAAARFDAPDKRAVGAFEMIVTVAQRSAGADGNYSHPSDLDAVKRWIDIAEREGLYVILDIQPGRSDFLSESKRYAELLKRPHVGLALDPEWRMEPWQRPGQLVGSVTAAEINEVSAWLSDLTLEHDLPEKIFMVHQFQIRMIKNKEDLIHRPGLATVIHADGFGSRPLKLVTYNNVKVDPPFYNGFKLFIDEDRWIFQPNDLLSLTDHPVPDLVTYQ